MRRVVWFLLLVLAAALLGLWLIGGDTDAPPAPPSTTASTTGPGDAASTDAALAHTAAATDVGNARTSAPREPDAEDSLRAATATGYSGRVVSAAGEPVAAIGVALLRVAADMALPFDLDVFARIQGVPELIVARAVTDGEGRFALHGVAPRGLCALRLGFADVEQAPLRWRAGQGTFVPVQRTPAPGEVIDLGDVKLKTGALLTGRVVGSDGPIAGARVRAARLPPLPFAAVPIERLTPDGALVVTIGGERGVVELPPWAADVFDALPIRETFTVVDGTFALYGVDAGDVVVAATAPLRASLLRQGVSCEAGGTHQLGDLFLADGSSAEVLVVDRSDQPIAGASVIVASKSTGIPVHIGERAGVSDAAGRVRVDGLPRGAAMAAARAPGDTAWHVGDPGNADGRLRVVIPGRHTLLLTVRDGAGKLPPGIKVKVVAGALKGSAIEFALFGMREPADLGKRLERLEDGRLRFADLADGPWCLVIGADGCATQTLDVDLRADEERIVTLRAARALRVRTIDVAGAPVANAKLHLSPQGGSRAERIVELPLAVGRTGADGWCTVRDLPTDSARLTAMHPLHGQVHALVKGDPGELVLQFAAAGSIRGVLTDGGRAPAPGRWVLVLERRYEGSQRGAMPDLPQMALPDLEGAFTFPALQPGKWRVTAQDSLTDVGTVAGMVQYMARQKQILPWNKAEVDLRGGEDAVVTLDAMLDAKPVTGPGAVVRGTVTIDGLPAAGAVVVGASRNPDRTITSRVDRGGAFDLGRCPAGALRVVVVPNEVAETRLKENVFSHHTVRDITVVPEQPVDLRFEITTGSLFGEVRDWNGAVVDDCRIVLFDRGGDGRSSSLRVVRSDPRGAFRFERIPEGIYELRAQKDGFGKQTMRDVRVASGVQGPVAVALLAIAKVSGRVETGQPGKVEAVVHLLPEDGGEPRRDDTSPDGKFELSDVPVGRYRIEVAPRGAKSRPAGVISVVSPATADLVLRVDG